MEFLLGVLLGIAVVGLVVGLVCSGPSVSAGPVWKRRDDRPAAVVDPPRYFRGHDNRWRATHGRAVVPDRPLEIDPLDPIDHP